MTDPVFTTRADLTRWMSGKLSGANKALPARQLALLSEIKRVTLAHSHLPYEATP